MNTIETGGLRDVDYARRHEEIVGLHSDEVRPALPGKKPVLGIVFKSFREFANGNFTEQLRTLSRQSADPEDFVAVFSVNNTRAHFLLDKAYGHKHDQDLKEHYNGRSIKLEREDLSSPRLDNPIENQTLSDYIDSNYPSKNFLLDIAAVRENLAMLDVLALLTSKINQLKSSESEDYSETLVDIERIAMPFMDDAQIAELLSASSSVMKRKINLNGVNLADQGKSLRTQNLGEAMDHGAHMAIDLGVEYLDFRDMDQFSLPTGVEKIVDLMKGTDRPDVFFRDLYITPSNHPEYFDPEDYLGLRLLDYFSAVSIEAQVKYQNPESNIGTGKIVCSKDLFKKIGGYPHKSISEDFEFSNLVIDNQKNTFHVSDIASVLVTKDRGRDESYDGARYSNRLPEAILESIQNRDSKYASLTKDILGNYWREFVSIQDDPDRLEIFIRKRIEYFNREQSRRRTYRKIFLGSVVDGDFQKDGLVDRAIDSLTRLDISIDDLRNPRKKSSFRNELLNNSNLTDRQKIFFMQNPLLVNGFGELLLDSEIEPTDREKVKQFFVENLPELFAEPIDREPEYNPNKLDGDQLKKAYDYIHLVFLSKGIDFRKKIEK